MYLVRKVLSRTHGRTPFGVQHPLGRAQTPRSEGDSNYEIRQTEGIFFDEWIFYGASKEAQICLADLTN
jgi:hypothetical protein